MADPSSNKRQVQSGHNTRRSSLLSVANEQDEESQSGARSKTGRPADRNVNANPRQFLFIDANTDRSTSGEAVRVHVMRESHRSRRERQGSQNPNRNRRPTAQDEMVILDFRNNSRPSSTPPTEKEPAGTSRVPTPSSPIDWPSVIRVGVSQVSLESMHEMYRLAEGYLKSVRLLQPEVLHLCKEDLLSMSAYLALASLQHASSEHESANIASVQFESRALELLRMRITQTVEMHTDTTILAVLLLSQLEQCKGNLESAQFHRNALQKLIRDRGGMMILKSQHLEMHDILHQAGLEDIEI